MNFREVTLTQGMVALVDEADYELVMAAGPWSYERSSVPYARRNAKRSDGSHVPLRMHGFLTGWPLTDHINGDGLDNRRANLRPATASQNHFNQRLRSNNTSGFKGVSLDKRYDKWAAHIRADGRRRSLGLYADPADAALAYDAAAREIAGEFACVNFPLPGERGAR